MLVLAALGPRVVRHRVATHGRTHIAVHLVTFAFLSVLIEAAIPGGAKRAAWAGIAGASLTGAGLEFLQSVHYGTRFEWRDAVYDASGALIGYAAARLLTTKSDRNRLY